jgi:hypothetical protein
MRENMRPLKFDPDGVTYYQLQIVEIHRIESSRNIEKGLVSRDHIQQR